MAAHRVVWFSDVEKEDVALVGGKGANLGEMTRAGFPVPPGFIVTSPAYFEFLIQNKLQANIKKFLQEIDYTKPKSIENAAKKIQNLILRGKIDESLTKEIFTAYSKLHSGVLSHALVAVRSSATAEDLPGASFAGQQKTFLNVQGEANLIVRIKEAWASLFESRAIFYRHEHHFDHFKVGIAVPVQKMIESDYSGVMFTLDPITNDRSKITIEAIYGLGELIVQGTVTPDHYEVAKDSMSMLAKSIATQQKKLIKKGTGNKEVKIATKEAKQQKITDEQIIALAQLGKKLEKHYYFPQDIEWAIEKGIIYLVQTRPVTTLKQQPTATQVTDAARHTQLVLQGDPASPGIATGPVKIITGIADLGKIAQGDILVAPHTNPDFVTAMKKAVAIVTDTGGRTSHAAIISRELGIPAIVGTTKGTKILKDGDIITVNGSKGEIYKGAVAITASSPIHHAFHPTATKLYVNLAEPNLASTTAAKPVDGVGLLRAEFIMADIGTHPRVFIHNNKKKEYIDRLAEGIAAFTKSFSPRPVVYRTSDFKSNEYRNLKGGKEFEPEEPNPMLGFRGAYRYIQDPHVFELELEAIKLVRNKMGYKNLWLMLPFVRTVAELTEVKKIIAASGLHRTPSFKLWMMVEIPANVILLEDFIAEGIDGVSIGSNDLTMLLLGTDRDNNKVASEFNELNPAVLWAFEKVIKTAQKHSITSSFCGQAASQYPALLKKLVTWGITSISVTPDVIDSTRLVLSDTEKELISK